MELSSEIFNLFLLQLIKLLINRGQLLHDFRQFTFKLFVLYWSESPWRFDKALSCGADTWQSLLLEFERRLRNIILYIFSFWDGNSTRSWRTRRRAWIRWFDFLCIFFGFNRLSWSWSLCFSRLFISFNICAYFRFWLLNNCLSCRALVRGLMRNCEHVGIIIRRS